MTARMKAGDIHRWDGQADIWRGRYQLVERVPGKPKTWIIEHLPDTPETIDAIVDYWAGQEAAGGRTDPIWDKTWAECTGDERPERVGEKTHCQMMEEELAHRAARYGRRSEIRFITAAAYAEYF